MSVIIGTNSARKQKSWRPRDSDDEDSVVAFKKSRFESWYVTLESESPVATDEDDESIYTVQGYETEYAHDTSDTNTHTWISSSSDGENVSVHLEYEIDTQSDRKESDEEFSSSDPENVVTVGLISSMSDRDVAEFADDSDNSRVDENGDSRKSNNYFKLCIICKNVNSNPLFSYCEKCFQNKKTHYNRKKGKRKLNSFSSQGSSSSKANSSLLGSQEFHEMDSGIGSSQEVGSTASSLDPLLNRQISSENTESDNIDSFVRSKNTKVVETIPERLSPLTILSRKLKKNGNVPKTSIGECDTNDATCLVCTTNRKNGIFVHGKYSHICCCYSCSKKVWTKNGRRCPICNRKVTQVLKAFYV